ncbi:MAG: transcriptional repressor [Oscillospiraceae bacterium]|jgi:Fur family peroxide stress response transcriptional regulator|nr:transcriptional repressor [Oscillospiraceae bacterium]
METTQRFSRKRQAIYDALMRSHAHPSAEELYHELKPDYPDLSLGTVYRNLKSMVAGGDAVCVANVEGRDRFDGHVEPHAHLVCRACGAVMDLPMTDALRDECARIADDGGVVIDPRSLRLFGLCFDCKDRGGPDQIRQ